MCVAAAETAEQGGFETLIRLLQQMEWIFQSEQLLMFAPSEGMANRPAVKASPSVAASEDAELARAVLGRDRKATADFVQRFSGPVYGYVRFRLAPRTELADDVVQEVFMSAWQQLGSYRGDSPLESWLFGIARHKVEDHYRDRLRRMDCWDDLEQDVSDDPVTELDLRLDRQKMAQKASSIISRLPEHYATILLWRYWERRSTREIAAATARTEKAVERLLARAREQFKQRWLDV